MNGEKVGRVAQETHCIHISIFLWLNAAGKFVIYAFFFAEHKTMDKDFGRQMVTAWRVDLLQRVTLIRQHLIDAINCGLRITQPSMGAQVVAQK